MNWTRFLSKSDDTELVREAWEASKQVGGPVADGVRELARTRNAAARRQATRDHFARSLAVNEIDETELFSIFAELKARHRRAVCPPQGRNRP